MNWTHPIWSQDMTNPSHCRLRLMGHTITLWRAIGVDTSWGSPVWCGTLCALYKEGDAFYMDISVLCISLPASFPHYLCILLYSFFCISLSLIYLFYHNLLLFSSVFTFCHLSPLQRTLFMKHRFYCFTDLFLFLCKLLYLTFVTKVFGMCTFQLRILSCWWFIVDAFFFIW